MIGKILDNRYELVEFIGNGGMALVYRAIDHRTGHSVAVKILRPEFNQDAEFLGRFEREATTASRMSHHNIVNLLDVGQDGEYRYLVMEFVRGKTLKDVIQDRGALTPEVAGQIAIRILSALQHAHKNGIIHRDIKPQNILVHSDGTQEALGLGGYLDIGLYDTMEDLFVNFLGATVFSILGYFHIKHKGKSKIASQFIPTYNEPQDSNPKSD